MNIQCPRCNAQTAFNPGNITPSGEKVICENCKLPFLVKQKLPAAGQQASLHTKSFGVETRDEVMVANANPHFCSAMKDFLIGHGFEVILAKDGVEVLQFLEIKLPHIAIVDVALPGMYGFEICDFIKNSDKLKQIKIILLASVYDKTRYKRMPASIYGADDYIEMHHIPDQLVPKINKLLGRDIAVARPSAKAMAREFEAVVIDEERLSEKIKDIAARDVKVGIPVTGGADQAHEEAKRLARIIISDIILYNQEIMEKGLREGSLLELLKDDIREAQAYYAKRVPAEVRKNTAYLKGAFEELIGKMKKEMGV